MPREILSSVKNCHVKVVQLGVVNGMCPGGGAATGWHIARLGPQSAPEVTPPDSVEVPV